MLTVSPIKNIKYYSDLAKEDYYLDNAEPNGIWLGKGARLLGLKGIVETEQYINIMQGHTPDKKYQLCQKSNKNHRHGWDLTFSAPKSVSVAWARANEELKTKIQEAHFQSVKQAVLFLEEHAAITRRSKLGLKREKVIGLVAATFEHATSRAQDPQLHTHCLIANVAPRNDGSWGTLESRDLYLWHKAAGSIYRAELSAQLQQLGFEVEQDKQFFKLKNIPNSICDYYSKRGEQIKQALAERGYNKSCSKSGDIAALSTRRKKENISREQLYNNWHKELDTLGFTEHQLTSLLQIEQPKEPCWLDAIEHQKLELNINTLEEIVSQQKSIFRKQDIFEKAAQIAQIVGDTASKAQYIAKEFINQKCCVALGTDSKNNELFTTKSILNNERKMIKGAKKLRNLFGFELSPKQIEQSILNKNFSLTEEQQEAVYSACQSNRFDIIQGSAGTGKSVLMGCVADAYKSGGVKVIGCTIAKLAANNLAKQANINTFTIAKLLKDKALPHNSVLIVDEAGQVSSDDLQKLIELVETKNSKLILVGEDKQLDAITHGGSLKYLSQPEVLGTTRVETIKRQREQWAREAVANFRDGNAEKALAILDKKNLLNFSEDSEQCKDLLIEKWKQYQNNNPHKQTLLLAQRWIDVTQLNEKVRNIMRAEGKIANHDISIKCTVSGKTFINKFAIGERIRLTKNDYAKQLSNGDLGNIVDIQSNSDGSYNFKIKLDNGNTVTINTNEYCNDDGHLYMTQAYAITVYSSQGLTVDGDVFVYYTSGMDRSNSYVACSRHKDNCHLFINKKEINEIIPEHLTGSLGEKAFFKTLAQKMSENNRDLLATKVIEFNKTKQVELEL